MNPHRTIPRPRIRSRRSFIHRFASFLWQVFRPPPPPPPLKPQAPRPSSLHIDMRQAQTPREQGGHRTERALPHPPTLDLDLKESKPQRDPSPEAFWGEDLQPSRGERWRQLAGDLRESWSERAAQLCRLLKVLTLLYAKTGNRLIMRLKQGHHHLKTAYPALFRSRSIPGLAKIALPQVSPTWPTTRNNPFSFLAFPRSSWENMLRSRSHPHRDFPSEVPLASMKRSNYPPRRPRPFLWPWLKHLFFFGLILILLFGGLFFIWIATLEIPQSNLDERIVAQSTKIYDYTGEVLLYDVFSDERRTVVPLEAISDNMVKAIMAIEDDEFYEHRGVRPLSIMRALYYKARDPSSRLQGGSTITQQVIKNALLTSDRRIERKIKEIVLAWRLEKEKSKDEILEIYLNEIPFGGPVYGVEQAARSFFDKPARDLTIAESAYLAALPKAPTTYLNDRARFDGRALFILNRMRDLGFISSREYQAARAEEVIFVERVDRGIKAPHFVFYVQEQLEEQLIESETALSQNGYNIRTSLDWELQERLEEVVATHTQRISENFQASNLALVALENKTGKIRALIGSKDYFAEDIDGKFNITTAFRQPGSTFKPFVYAQAFTRGYTPETILWDTPTEFSQSCFPDGQPRQLGLDELCYRPTNYDLQFRGPVNLRNALAQSLNVPAVKLLYLVGVGEAMSLARDLGITSLNKAPSFYGLNLVLGGGEVRMIDMASAYSVFANEGLRHPIAVWEEVTDREGEVLDEYEEQAQEVLAPEVAAMINDVLSDNDAKRPMFGAFSRLYYEDGRDVAVKTGTTNNYRDVWTAGYSSEITLVVWAGNNDNTPLATSPSSSVVGPFWREAMDVALEYYAAEAFTPAPSLEEDLKPVLQGSYEGETTVYLDPETQEVITDLTEEELEADLYEPQTSLAYHSILHYVDRQDVQGPVPEDPESDGLYEHFEHGLTLWLEEEGWSQELASSTPSESRELGQEVLPEKPERETIPFDFSIVSPAPNTLIDGSLPTDIIIETVGNRRTIDTIYFYLNNTYLGSGSYRTTSRSERLGNVRGAKEENTLKVIVEQTDGSRLEKSLTVYIQ